jgi:CRP/FNR family transcriptional regulator, cyclic AMP receptor protein
VHGAVLLKQMLLFLKHVPLFAELDDDELHRVAGATRHKLYPKGSIIFHEGDPGDCLIVIVKGRVKVILLGKDGNELIIRLLKPTEFLGEIALLDGSPRSATVMTVEPTEILEVARAPFLQLVLQQPGIALKIMTQLAAEIRRATEQVRTLSMFDVYGRVLRCLLLLAQDTGQSSRSRMVIRPRPSISELAQMIGCERETVSRALKTLRSTGYITDVDRGIAVEQRAIAQYFLPTLQNLAVTPARPAR